MNEEINNLKAQVEELLEWKKQKENQQISFPLDVASRNTIGAPYGEGSGSTALTQTYTADLMTGDLTGPKAYAQTVLVVINGVRYEFPSLI